MQTDCINKVPLLFLMSRLNGLNPFAHYLIIPIADTIRKLKIQTVKSFIDFVHTSTLAIVFLILLLIT